MKGKDNMGVPKQVIDMEAEVDKELNTVEGSGGEVVETAAKTEPKAEVAVEANKAVNAAPNPDNEDAGETKPNEPKQQGVLSSIGKSVDDDPRAAQREASAAGRLHALQGQMKAERDKWNGERESYESQIAELKSKLEEARAYSATRDNSDVDELRKELGDGYSDEDVARFAAAVDARVERKMRKLQSRFDEMDAEREQAAKNAAIDKASQFKERLEQEFPGFQKLDSQNDPRWIAFLGTSLGGVMEGTTYEEIARKALESLDYRKFACVVREFAKAHNVVFSPNGNPANGEVMGQVRPDNAPAQRTSNKSVPRRVPRSEIEQFRKDAFAHKAASKYGLTNEQVVEQLRFYEDAEAEGRVEERA